MSMHLFCFITPFCHILMFLKSFMNERSIISYAQAHCFAVLSLITITYSHVWLVYGFGRITSVIHRFKRY